MKNEHKQNKITILSQINEDLDDLGDMLALKIADEAIEGLKRYPKMPKSAHGINYFDYISIEFYGECAPASEFDWNIESEISSAIAIPWENLTPIEDLVKSYKEDFCEETDAFYNIVREKLGERVEENFKTERIQNYIKKYGCEIKDVPGKVSLNSTSKRKKSSE